MNPVECDPKDPAACGVKMYGIARVGEKGQIVIPKEVRAELGIHPGDSMLVMTKHAKAIALIKQEDLQSFIAYLQEELKSR
jgi:AbrB family looped-hinge helix DNA binding protein